MLGKSGKSCNISVNKSFSFSQKEDELRQRTLLKPYYSSVPALWTALQPQFLLPSSIRHNRKLNFYLFKFGSKSLDSLVTD